jgi:CheY-like chemotaxis protein
LRLSPLRILAVDNSAADVDQLQLAFERAALPHSVDVVHKARDAISYLASADPPPALVLLDLNLPDMPGFELLRLLRRDRRFTKIPVVVFTAREKTGDLQHSLMLGANSFLPKPLSCSEFVEDVESIKSLWLLSDDSASSFQLASRNRR